jgi:uncharacterized oligopeptide transporter (OPT) family protein
LISAIAQGVLGGNLDWNLIGLGAGIGAAAIVVDEVLRGTTAKYSLPPLALGMGIYLPMELTLFICVGALIGWFYDRWARTAPNPGFAERLGTLMATGLIVGESLLGVVYAAVVAAAEKAGAKDSANVLAVVTTYPFVAVVSLVIFFVAIFSLYGWTRGRAAIPLPATEGPDAVQGELR